MVAVGNGWHEMPENIGVQPCGCTPMNLSIDERSVHRHSTSFRLARSSR